MEKTIIKSIDGDSRKPSIIGVAVIIFLLLSAVIVSYAQLHKPSKDMRSRETDGAQQITNTDLVSDLTNSAGDVLGTVTEKTQKQVETVVEDTKSTILESASNSASTLKDYVWDNTAGLIIKELEKLPEDEQDKIKDQICN
ncbi:MAG: hypothetical protein WC489_03505 [Patescibacteria group bacterium]